MILAEVSDKIPTLTYYWGQAVVITGIGYLLSRFSVILSLGLALLLATAFILEISGYDSSDPFWEAVKIEKGMNYIIQSWATTGISSAVITFVSIRKIIKKPSGEPVGGHNSGGCAPSA